VVDREALTLLWLHEHDLPARGDHDLPARGDHDLVHTLVAVLVAAAAFARRLGLPGTI